MLELPTGGLSIGAGENRTKVYDASSVHTAPLRGPLHQGADSIGPIENGVITPQHLEALERIGHQGTKGLAVDAEGKVHRALSLKEVKSELGYFAAAKAAPASAMRTMGDLMIRKPGTALLALGGTALAAVGIGDYESKKSYKEGQAKGYAAGQTPPPQMPSYY